MQSPGDVLFLVPDVLIDVTECHQAKRDALARHRSQRIACERVLATDEYWGRVAGVKYAETFRTVLKGLS